MKTRWYLFRRIMREAIRVLRGRAERVKIREEPYYTKIEVMSSGYGNWQRNKPIDWYDGSDKEESNGR